MVNAEISPRSQADFPDQVAHTKSRATEHSSARFWRFWPLAIWTAAVVALVALTVGAAGRDYFLGDVVITNWVQAFNLPGLNNLLSFASFLTSSHVGIAMWLVLLILLGLNGRPMEAMVVFAVSAMSIGDNFLGHLVDRPRPSAELISVTQNFAGPSFPSGHTSGAVRLYGVIIVSLNSEIQNRAAEVFHTTPGRVAHCSKSIEEFLEMAATTVLLFVFLKKLMSLTPSLTFDFNSLI